MKIPAFELRDDREFILEPASPPSREHCVMWLDHGMKKVTGDESSETLAAVARVALTFLVGRARKGDGHALWLFAELTKDSTEGLSAIAKEKPKVLQPIARKFNRWPQMRSRMKNLSDSDLLLRSMKLGEDVPLRMDEKAKWQADDAADVAIQLFSHLERIRAANVFWDDGKPLKWPGLSLPDFSKASALRWWVHAQRSLLSAYPSPENNWKLGRIAKEKTPGRSRARILSRIKERFVAMAK